MFFMPRESMEGFPRPFIWTHTLKLAKLRGVYFQSSTVWRKHRETCFPTSLSEDGVLGVIPFSPLVRALCSAQLLSTVSAACYKNKTSPVCKVFFVCIVGQGGVTSGLFDSHVSLFLLWILWELFLPLIWHMYLLSELTSIWFLLTLVLFSNITDKKFSSPAEIPCSYFVKCNFCHYCRSWKYI